MTRFTSTCVWAGDKLGCLFGGYWACLLHGHNWRPLPCNRTVHICRRCLDTKAQRL